MNRIDNPFQTVRVTRYHIQNLPNEIEYLILCYLNTFSGSNNFIHEHGINENYNIQIEKWPRESQWVTQAFPSNNRTGYYSDNIGMINNASNNNNIQCVFLPECEQVMNTNRGSFYLIGYLRNENNVIFPLFLYEGQLVVFI